MLSDGDDDAKLAALEAATGRLLRALFSFLLLLWVGALLIGVPWLFQGKAFRMLCCLGKALWPSPQAEPWPFSCPDPSGVTRLRPGCVQPLCAGPAPAPHAPEPPHVHMRLMRREVAQWRKRGGAQTLVFVGHRTGRAGTTSVLERLVATGAYHSLNYANMPLVLAPGLWKRFHNPGTGELQERSHGDGSGGPRLGRSPRRSVFPSHDRRSYVTDAALKAHDVTPNSTHLSRLSRHRPCVKCVPTRCTWPKTTTRCCATPPCVA